MSSFKSHLTFFHFNNFSRNILKFGFRQIIFHIVVDLPEMMFSDRVRLNKYNFFSRLYAPCDFKRLMVVSQWQACFLRVLEPENISVLPHPIDY